MPTTAPGPIPRLALVGDRSPGVRAHARIPRLVEALRTRDGLAVDPYWLGTDDVEPGSVAGFDGVWLLPGSPYRSEAGVLAAIRDAREHRIPFLGTCGGFQHALLEFARNVCGLEWLAHAENDPDAEECLIVPLSCSLVGHEVAVHIEPGSLAEAALGRDRTVERYLCAYGPDERHLATLEAHGLRLSGRDDAGEVRVAELPGHPFFLATLFQPELAGDGSRAHPVVRTFASAAAEHAATMATV
jgi:CTP synthase (UTP-ammonia lyase)